MKKIVLVVLAVLASASMVQPAGSSTTPGVNATPNNNSSHPWTTDECSWVPESGYHSAKVMAGRPPMNMYVWVTGRFDFGHACVHHDGCYRGNWAARSTCDQWFLNDMRASCDAVNGRGTAQASVCNGMANVYFSGVRAFGGFAFAQRTHLIRIK